MILNPVLYECAAQDGIVTVCSSSREGKGHIANTQNKYLIITEEEKICIPCFGFHETEKNVSYDPNVELMIGSHNVPGKMGMGTGFLLKGKAEFQNHGALFQRMHDKCSFANRVLVFTPGTCVQTI